MITSSTSSAIRTSFYTLRLSPATSPRMRGRKRRRAVACPSGTSPRHSRK
nr:MAG TPA: hypothetical protein [Caudoviricetes sp.]DAQ35479.1 MAG TPA: hypothetical protein [Caudoviricetes sp.]